MNKKAGLIGILAMAGALGTHNVGGDFYNLTEFIPGSHSKVPLNITNTILECYPEHEERAMKVLDELITLKWEGVKDYLNAFDRF